MENNFFNSLNPEYLKQLLLLLGAENDALLVVSSDFMIIYQNMSAAKILATKIFTDIREVLSHHTVTVLKLALSNATQYETNEIIDSEQYTISMRPINDTILMHIWSEKNIHYSGHVSEYYNKEIQNQLSVILSSVSALKSLINNNHHTNVYIESITKNSLKVLRNIEHANLLHPSITSDSLNFHVNDVCDMCRNIISKSSKYLSYKKQTIELVCPDMLLAIYDIHYISMAIYNILSNASLYTPEGTHIKIEILNLDKSILISIQDNGPGISNDVMTKINQIYDPLDNPDSSEVLSSTFKGISTIKKIINLHYGDFYISASSAGTQCMLKLPKDIHEIYDLHQYEMICEDSSIYDISDLEFSVI